MKLDMHILENYINKKQLPEEDAWFYNFTNGSTQVLDTRQEVADALCTCLIESIQQFPYFNQECITHIFAHELPLLDHLIVLPIVASNHHFDSEVILYNDTHYLLIDILNIADYTIHLHEMRYILQNQITLQVLKYLIHTRFSKKDGYLGMLEDSFFCDGLAQYLAWNEDCMHYPFHESVYIKRKNDANTLLHKFYFSEDRELQEKVQSLLMKTTLWNQFPIVYGMFYAHEVYLANKEKGLCEMFTQGPSILRELLLRGLR